MSTIDADGGTALSIQYGEPQGIGSAPGVFGLTNAILQDGNLTKSFEFYLEYPAVETQNPKVEELSGRPRREGCAQWTGEDGKPHTIKPLATYKSNLVIVRCAVPAIGRFRLLSLGTNELILKQTALPNEVGTLEVSFLHPGPQLLTSMGDAEVLGSPEVDTASTVPHAMTVIADGGGLEGSTGTLLKQVTDQARTVDSRTGDISSFVVTNKRLLAGAETGKQFLWLATGVALGFVPTAVNRIWKRIKKLRLLKAEAG